MSKKSPVILIVDDLKTELARYLNYIKDLNYQSFGVSSLEDALKLARSRRFDLVLTDIHLSPDETKYEGLELIQTLKAEQPNLTFMAMSFDPSYEIAEKAKALGAWMFLRKPLNSAEELSIHIRRALDVSALEQSTRKSSSTPAMKALLDRHPEGVVMNAYLRRAVRGAVENDDMCTVIIGETGTGKEEIAKLIHRYRSEKDTLPFVPLNCANLQGDLMMSTLFGHKKGAFTGAVENTLGVVGQANGGILFLDEFHRLTIQAQERLLRVLQDGSYQKVGETIESRSHFQLIAATSLDLEQAAVDGIILMDLRMRLYGMEIKIPPLRERHSDLSDFIDWFFAKLDKPYILSPEERLSLVEVCKKFYWQGNIRQLFGVLNVLVMNASLDNEPILAERLPTYKTMLPPRNAGSDEANKLPSGSMGEAMEALLQFSEKLGDLEQLVEKIEKAAIESAMDKIGSIKDVCVALNLPRSTLDGKRRKYGLGG